MYIRHNKIVGNLGNRTCYQDSVLGNKQKHSQTSSTLCQLKKRYILFLNTYKEIAFLFATIHRI